MATTKVSALAETTSPQANDELLINQSGVSKKVKITNLPAGLDNTKLPLAGGQMTGNITMSGTETVDGRDISVDGAQLDTNTSAIATKAPIASPTFTGTVAIPNISDLESAVTANTAKVTNATHTGEVTGATALTIADNVVDEANLKVSNAPTDGYVLTAQSGNTGGLTWAAASGGGGASTLGGLTDVSLDITNFVDSLLIQTNSDGSAPTTGTLNAATGNIGIGKSTFSAITSGDYNTAIGYNTGLFLTGGEQNEMIGYHAGKGLTTGARNTLIGTNAGTSVTTGVSNVIIGNNAGELTSTSSYSVRIGYAAGSNNNQSGSVFIGQQAGGSNQGAGNTVVGRQALFTYGTGANCTAFGHQSLMANTSGSNNTAIGASAGNSITTGSYNQCIGYNAQPLSATTSNQFTLGDANIADLRCNDTSISALSDQRDKTEIVDSSYGLDFINTVQPRQFKWATREGNIKDGKTRLGFIAQELLTACNGNNNVLDLVLGEGTDKMEAKYGNLVPILVKAIQELSTKNDALEARITALES
jgi:hypothetical protein